MFTFDAQQRVDNVASVCETKSLTDAVSLSSVCRVQTKCDKIVQTDNAVGQNSLLHVKKKKRNVYNSL